MIPETPIWFVKNPLALGLDFFRMTENEYRELVMAAFDRAFKANRLSQELVLPTAGSLKAEAVKVCSKRFDTKDETVLGSFIKSEPGTASYFRAIKNCHYQIFRPLSDFLNDRSRGTTFKNIQLLAWLIDFKPRPFHPELVIPQDVIPEPEPSIATPPGNAQPISVHYIPTPTELKDNKPHIPLALEQDEKKKPGGQGGTSDKTPNKRWLVGIAVLLIMGLFTWLFFPINNCMYWDNDHYIATSCNVPRTDTPLVRLDPVKLRDFRRLHHVDTLTYNSVGKFGYVRVGGIIEVYTTQGKHPLYSNRMLAPLTYYAVNVCKNQHGY
ncbi:hypothetical protein [Mucilaginibacter phyllosphaerae]